MCNNESPNASPSSADCTLYESAGDGLREVRNDYQYWTEQVSALGPQMCYALIAANWAAFGTLQKILESPWARASIVLAIVGLGLGLLFAKLLAESHYRQVGRAYSDTAVWQAEFEASLEKRDPWPFTRTIEVLGRVQRELKTWLPLIGGVCLVVALLIA